MLRNAFPERLGARIGSSLDAAVGKCCQLGRIGLASNQRLKHGAPASVHNVGDEPNRA